ncbi:MAG: SsrA-binding protein SmpB [Oscillospiraceae bacterium]|nr:SsrA-binding protein SmpB [Oscillospiraceae bacterium]
MIAQNKKARHEYFVEDSFEAGIELFGTEVKSIRAGKISFLDSYCYVDKSELFISGFHISPYEKGNIFNKDPLRLKRLLMHKKEIIKMYYYVSKDGYTLVPLSVYFSNSRVKMEIGLCKGKKLYDKREDLAERSLKRESERYEKSRNQES